MRKLVLLSLIASSFVPVAATAQTRHEAWRDRQELRQDRRELREDRRDWRQDRRDARRSRVAYVAPYRGWRYRPVTVGYRLQPVFWGSRYYVADPVRYHLRAAPRWARWIRYGDDLVLVNVRTGRVLEVVQNGYW